MVYVPVSLRTRRAAGAHPPPLRHLPAAPSAAPSSAGAFLCGALKIRRSFGSAFQSCFRSG